MLGFRKPTPMMIRDRARKNQGSPVDLITSAWIGAVARGEPAGRPAMATAPFSPVV